MISIQRELRIQPCGEHLPNDEAVHACVYWFHFTMVSEIRKTLTGDITFSCLANMNMNGLSRDLLIKRVNSFRYTSGQCVVRLITACGLQDKQTEG